MINKIKSTVLNAIMNMKKQLFATLFVLALGIQIVSAQFNYVSPLPGSKYHNPQTNIILKNGSFIDVASVIQGDLLEIVGSVTGTHSWHARLSDDKKTVVIRPDEAFAFSETVYVTVKDVLRKETGELINGTSFSFETKDAFTSEQAEKIKKWRHEDFVESFGYDPEDPDPDLFETPDSFPTFTINVNDNASPGRIFYGSQQELDETDTNAFPTILENDGTLYWARDAGRDGHDFKINHSGYLSYYSYNLSNWKVLDSNFIIIDSIQCGNGYQDETNGHDFQMFADGHYYVIAYNDLVIDMTAYGGQPDALVKGLIVQELDQNKDVIFQWRSWDHFQFTDANQWTPLTNAKVDYVHGNSVERDFDGNILISCRNMDELTKINRETGEIIWRMNGDNNQFTFVNDNIVKHFSQQHDLRRIANGNITIFNNGNKLAPEISSAKEYHLDEVNKIATLVWYYEHPDVGNNKVFARASGSAQRLPGGNTIICWGTIFFNKNIPSMTEVDSNKNIVWEMTFDEEGQKSYRTYKFEFIRCPQPPDSTLSATTLSTDSVLLEWGNSNNSSSYLVEYKLTSQSDWTSIVTTENSLLLENLTPESFYDWRIQAICEKFTDTSYLSVQLPFNTLSTGSELINGQDASAFEIYPNPAGSMFTFTLFQQVRNDITLSLINPLGQVVSETTFSAPAGRFQKDVNLLDLPKGVYTVQLASGTNISRQQLVIQ